MSGLRIVHLCRGRDWRGGERQVRLLVRMLARHGELSQLVATGRNSRLAGALLEDGAAVLPLPWSGAYDPRAWAPLVRRLRQLAGASDPVLIHAHDSHALGLGLLASRWLSLPLVATRRSVSAAGPLWRIPCRVIAISAAVEQALVASGVPRARVVHIPSAIDITAVQKVAPWKAAETPCLIAVGALTPEKGHATLIDALALLHRRRLDSRLLLLGGGSERRALVARAKQRGVDSHVEFAGEVPDATSRIAAARLFVQPSHREALGSAVLEAMALGIPVVASRTGGLSELLGGGAGILVPPGDASALAAAIEQLLTTPSLCTEVAGAARVRVAQFDAPGMADKVADVYRSALGDT